MKQNKTTESCKPLQRYKRGWNWRVEFGPCGSATLVKIELLYKTVRGFDTIISPYPYGEGHGEDSVAEAIQEAFRDLYVHASEEYVEVTRISDRYFTKYRIAASIDSDLVQEFACALSGTRRVIVDVNGDAKEEC